MEATSVEPISGLAHVLQSYGPWALVAVAMVALYYQWRAYVDVRDKHESFLKEQAKSTVTLVEEMTTASVEHRVAIDKVVGALQSMERRLENVEKKPR
jgi:hypothetical protein